MIVDNCFRFREHIKKLLTDCHFKSLQLFEFTDGLEAVKNYRKLEPDWILMDIQISNMNGFEASKFIKKNNPDANIILISQYDDEAYRDYAKELGIKYYILKDRLSDMLNIFKKIESL